MVRWYDGLFGGLVAGCTVALFYAIVTVAWLHDATLPGFFAEIASGFIHGQNLEANPWAVAFGVGVHFCTAAFFGIIYALVAERFRAMWHAPFSVFWGMVFGLVVWFTINDVLVPLLGVTSTLPLWQGLVANTVFYGVVISEYMTIVRNSKSAADSKASVA